MTDINAGSVRGEFKFDIQKAIADLQAAIKGVNELTTKTKEAEKEAEKEGKAVSEQGKRTEEAGKKAEEAGKKIDEAGKKTEGAGKRAEEAGKREQEAGKKTEEAGKKADEAGRKTEEAGKKAEGAGKRIDEAGKKTEGAGRRAKEAGDKAKESGEKMKQSGEDARKASLGTGLLNNELSRLKLMFTGLSAVMAVGATLKFASEIEDGFVGVKRTTGAVGAEFEKLRGQILQLSVDLKGIQIGALQNIAQIGGQLGVPKSELGRFTETVAKASRAMDIADDAAANFLARIQVNMKEPMENLIRIANVANELGNTTTATANEILEISTRMSGTANVFGLTTAEMIALAAATRHAGEEVEVSSSAWVQVMNRMLTDTKKFAHVAGQDVKQFTETLRTNPIQAIKELAVGLSQLDKFGQAKALEDLELTGVRVGPVLTKLASNLNELDRIMKSANEEWRSGASVQKEYEASASTLSASLSRLWNAVKLLADSLAGGLLPVLAGVTDAIGNLLQWMAGYGRTSDDVSRSIRGQVDEAEGLRKAFDDLAAKTNRTRAEQDELNRVAEALTRIFPQLTIEYNKNGDAIGYMADQYARFLAIKNKAAITEQEKNLQDLELQRVKLQEEIATYRTAAVAPGGVFFGGAYSPNMAGTGTSSEAERQRKIAELQRQLDQLDRDAQKSAEYILYLRTGKMPPAPKRPDAAGGGGAATEASGIREYVPFEDEEKKKEKKEREPWFGYGYESQVNRELSAIQQAELRRAEQEIELNRKRAASAAETADEKLLAEQEYYAALQRLQQEAHEAALKNLEIERREKIKELEKTEKALKPKDDPDYATKIKEIQEYRLQIEELHDKKILQLKKDYSLKQQEIAQNLADAQKRIREEEANEEKRILEKRQREYERMMRERERTFRKIFEPLFEGGDFADILKNALKEDLVDFMAANFPASLPIGDQKGGVFNLLMGGGEKVIENSFAPTTKPSAKQPVITSAATDYTAIAQQQTEVQEQIAENTKQTVVQAEKTNRGLMSLPINLGHIIGAVLGVGLSGGKLSFKSILTTFGLSLLGGFANAAFSGLTTTSTPKVNEYGTVPLPKADIPAMDLPMAVTTAKVSPSEVPRWNVPEIDIPAPEIETPTLKALQIPAPEIETPKLKVDVPLSMLVEAPKWNVPEIDVPAPEIETPKLKVDVPLSMLAPANFRDIPTEPLRTDTTKVPPIDLNRVSIPDSVPSAPIEPIIQIPAPRLEMPSLTMPANTNGGGASFSAKTAPVNVNTTLHVNTGGAPFDRAAAQSLEKSIEKKVTEIVLRDFRRGGAIRRTQEAAI